MSYKKRPNFYESEEAVEVKEILLSMQNDPKYFTDSSYSADGEKYPDHVRSFVEKHMAYLQSHPDVNASQYLANLRLITKLR
jgi:hypothetical protein